jgi:hypothetical protein
VLPQLAGFREPRLESLRLAVCGELYVPLSRDELRASLLKNTTADDVLAMFATTSEFKLPAPPLFFPVAEVTQHWPRSQDFLDELFQDLVSFIVAIFLSFPLFGLYVVMPSFIIKNLITVGRC